MPSQRAGADQPGTTDSEQQARVEHRKRRRNEIVAITLILVAVMGLISLLSYSPSDIPGETYSRLPGAGVANWCGKTGAKTAYTLFTAIGYSSYVFVLLVLCWGWSMFVRKEFRDWGLKIFGLVCLLCASSALLSLLIQRPLHIPTAGGVMGNFVGGFLFANLGLAGSYLSIVLIFCLSVLLATDWLFYDVFKTLYGGYQGWKYQGAMGEVFQAEDTITVAEPARKMPPIRHHGERPEATKPAKKETPAAKPVAQRDVGSMIDVSDASVAVGTVVAAKPKKVVQARPMEAAAELKTEAPAVPAQLSEEEVMKAREEELRRLQEEANKRKMEQREEMLRRREEARKARLKEAQVGDSYQLPEIEVLVEAEQFDHQKEEQLIRDKTLTIESTLKSFDVEARVVQIDRGPVITQFELDLAAGIKVNKVMGLSDNLAMALKAPSLRIVAPIPGKSTVGIEIPNQYKETVRLRELMETCQEQIQQKSLPLLLGKDSSGEPMIFDLTEMPHLLIAGTTGSGKSVCMNAIIMSMLLTQKPTDVKMIMVDPKMVELSIYRDIPHLMHPVVTDMKKAQGILEWIVEKMEERYGLFSIAGVRNIKSYNKLEPERIRERFKEANELPDDEFDAEEVPTHLPYIMVLIDELADLMMSSPKEVESAIIRLSQKSRAVGIHLVVATQRPSVDVITGLIKANMPCRIAFQVMSKVDSRTIIDSGGADKLLGKGDMLLMPPGSAKLVRGQSTLVDDSEIRAITKMVKTQAEPIYEAPKAKSANASALDPREEDELYDQAVEIVVESQRGSVSLLQRRLGVGYSRASRLIDMMSEEGVVGEYKGSHAREVLYTPDQWKGLKGVPPQ